MNETFQGRHFEERLRQARTSFNVAIVCACVGTLIIFVGIALSFVVNISAGVVTGAAGVISDIVGFVLFKIYKYANDRLDRQFEEMNRGFPTYMES